MLSQGVLHWAIEGAKVSRRLCLGADKAIAQLSYRYVGDIAVE
jgi:hypothetical protein